MVPQLTGGAFGPCCVAACMVCLVGGCHNCRSGTGIVTAIHSSMESISKCAIISAVASCAVDGSDGGCGAALVLSAAARANGPPFAKPLAGCSGIAAVAVDR
eukprot:2098854-Amphidinium_carterae.1